MWFTSCVTVCLQWDNLLVSLKFEEWVTGNEKCGAACFGGGEVIRLHQTLRIFVASFQSMCSVAFAGNSLLDL